MNLQPETIQLDMKDVKQYSETIGAIEKLHARVGWISNALNCFLLMLVYLKH